MPVSTAVETVPFSRTLRESTRAAHQRAHDSAYMRALFAGELALGGYALLAEQYWFVYQALERAADLMAADPVGRRFVHDELRRVPHLARDLAYLSGPDWRAAIRPLPATEAYAERIRTAAHGWAGGFVAHHYTRYLGDLAGGRSVQRLLRDRYDVTGEGALFYDFTGLGSVPAFRRRYRAELDAVPWEGAERERVVGETLAAFEFNIAVFDELAERLDMHRANLA